jgi:hypothetical protein
MDNPMIREIRKCLAEAVQLLDGVRIEQDRDNMKRYIVGVDRVETALDALYNLENERKEEEKHEDDHDQQK